MGCMMHEGNEVQYGNLNCMKILVCVHALCVLSVCVCIVPVLVCIVHVLCIIVCACACVCE